MQLDSLYLYIKSSNKRRRRNRCMKDVVLDEVMKELNWKERIIVKILAKTFYKVYKIGITFGFNNK